MDNQSPQQPPDGSPQSPAWERQVLEKLAFAALAEQRSRRRWSIFFRCLAVVYIAFITISLMGTNWFGSDSMSEEKHTAIIYLRGVIDSDGESSAEKIVPALQAAFEDKGTAGVILRINSPGGSPVQSGIIYDEIHRLRGKYPDIKLYAVVEDLCASGGYYVASAADKIYVDKASIIGSIGVLMNGFGFTGTMEKLGIERRLLAAGTNKGFLDPFSPLNAKQEEHARTMLSDIHDQFIAVVKKGRGQRLKADTPELFSGLMWTGAQGIELGLADDFGSVDSVARDVIKAEKTLDYSIKENIAERFAKRLGAKASMGIINSLTEAFSTKAQ